MNIKFQKALALVLVFILTVCSTPVYASTITDENNEHVFTYEELACMGDYSIEPALNCDENFTPITNAVDETQDSVVFVVPIDMNPNSKGDK